MYGGDVLKKAKAFSKISDWMVVHNKDLYDVFETAGVMGYLIPRRDAGVTLLVPPPAEVKRIRELLESKEEGVPESATDEVLSLIIHTVLHTPDDFLRHKGNLPNMLRRTLVVEDKKGNSVLLAGHGKTIAATADASFRGLKRVGTSSRNNLAVWNIDGRLKIDTPAAAKETPVVKKGGKRRAAHHGGAPGANLSKIISEAVAAKIAAVSRGPVDGVEPCPLAELVASVVQGWHSLAEAGNEEAKACLSKARCLLSGQPTVDFFKLVCNPLVFSADLVDEGMKRGRGVLAPSCVIEDFLKTKVEDEYLLATPKGRAEYTQALDKLREDWDRMNAKQFRTALESLYAKLDTENRIAGLATPVYCKELAADFQKYPGLHEVLDELAFSTWCYLCDMVSQQDRMGEKRAEYRRSVYAEIFNSFLDRFGPAGVQLPTGGRMSQRAIFTKETAYMGSLVVPDAARCFAKSAAARCHCHMVVKGAGKSEDSDSEDEDDEEEPDQMKEAMDKVMAKEQAPKQAPAARMSEIVQLASGLSEADKKELCKLLVKSE